MYLTILLPKVGGLLPFPHALGCRRKPPSWKPLEPELSAQCTVRKTQYIIGPPPPVFVSDDLVDVHSSQHDTVH